MVQFHHIHFHADGGNQYVKKYRAQFTRTRPLIIPKTRKTQSYAQSSGHDNNPKEPLFQATQVLNKAIGVCFKEGCKPSLKGRS